MLFSVLFRCKTISFNENNTKPGTLGYSRSTESSAITWNQNSGKDRKVLMASAYHRARNKILSPHFTATKSALLKANSLFHSKSPAPTLHYNLQYQHTSLVVFIPIKYLSRLAAWRIYVPVSISRQLRDMWDGTMTAGVTKLSSVYI